MQGLNWQRRVCTWVPPAPMTATLPLVESSIANAVVAKPCAAVVDLPPPPPVGSSGGDEE